MRFPLLRFCLFLYSGRMSWFYSTLKMHVNWWGALQCLPSGNNNPLHLQTCCCPSLQVRLLSKLIALTATIPKYCFLSISIIFALFFYNKFTSSEPSISMLYQCALTSLNFLRYNRKRDRFAKGSSARGLRGICLNRIWCQRVAIAFVYLLVAHLNVMVILFLC